jgi:ribosomal protein S18 acetylase RimI-like enzyme
MEAIRVELLNHRDRVTAEYIHSIQMAAYAQEARLLSVATFPPLQRTVVDVEQSSDCFLGARRGSTLMGVVTISVGKITNEAQISSLVVLPQFQRCGVGRALVSAAIVEFENQTLTVATGALNQPALELYARLGFAEVRRRHLDKEMLTIVELRRPCT